MKLNFKTLMLGFSLKLATLLPAVQADTTTAPAVLATTFPIYQMVRNVTNGREGIKVDLLLPSQMGCPHDYALTPQDLLKLATADILVINGLGMEEFIGSSFVKNINSRLAIIDSSVGIKETIEYSEEPDHAHKHDHHHDNHNGINPHLFVSPRLTAQMVQNIARELSVVDPNGAAIYVKNAENYAATMHKLADAMYSLGKRLKNKLIVQPHGIFDYLARDMGLSIVETLQPHGQEPSASAMRHIIETIRHEQAGAIFTEPQYPSKVGITIAKETGIPIAEIDSVASGPDQAPLNYYATVMYQNLKIITETLGVK